MIQKLIVLGLAVGVVGCASKSKDISAAYVSPTAYSGLTCEQLAVEAQTISRRAIVASGQQDRARSGDVVKTTVGVVLFWPALLFNEGDGAKAAEVASLKGQMQAIEQVAARKKCDITFQQD
jgi:hypothetical protein